MTETIVDFLLARITEDEAVARRASAVTAVEWVASGSVLMHITDPTTRLAEATAIVEHYRMDDAWHHAERHDPARVLAECQAKRAIIADHAPADESYERLVHHDNGEVTHLPRVPACRQCTTSTQPERITSYWDQENRIVAPCDTLRHLAAVYADHPDYRQEWRP